MKRAVASILIILGCVGIMPNTHAQPSPALKAKPKPVPTGRLYDITTSIYDASKPTPSPHRYVGRNDGQVQQSTAGKPGGVPRGGNYSINSGMRGSGSPAQKDKGKVTAQGVKATSSPRSSIGRNDGTLQQVTSSYVGGAGSQGKPAGGKKKG
jgi:hypothetical protein